MMGSTFFTNVIFVTINCLFLLIISTGCWSFVSYIGRRSEALTLIQGHNEWRLKYEDDSIVFVRSVIGGRN